MFGIELKEDSGLGHRAAPLGKKGENRSAAAPTRTTKKVGIQRKLAADKVQAKPTSKNKEGTPVNATLKQRRAKSPGQRAKPVAEKPRNTQMRK